MPGRAQRTGQRWGEVRTWGRAPVAWWQLSKRQGPQPFLTRHVTHTQSSEHSLGSPSMPSPDAQPCAVGSAHLVRELPGDRGYTSPRSSLSQLQGIRSRQGPSSQKTVMPVSETGCHLVTNPTDSLQTPGAGLQSLRILQQGSWHRAAVPGVTAREAGFPCRAGSSPSCPTSDPTPCSRAWEDSRGRPRTWSSCTQWESQRSVLAPGFGPAELCPLWSLRG